MYEATQEQSTEAQEQPAVQQSQEGDWRAGIPEELQGVVSRFNDLPSLVKSYSEARSIIGKKVGSFAESDWKTYANIMSPIMNIPTSPDGYDIDFDTPEGGESLIAEQDSRDIMVMCHQLGLNKEQAQALHDGVQGFVENINTQMEQKGVQALESSVATLEKEWGNATDTKMNAVNNAIHNVLPKLCGVDAEVLKNELIEANVYCSPTFMKILANIGELAMESSSRGYNNMAPADARTRFDHLTQDPDFMRARCDQNHPNHKAAKEEFSALCRLVNS